MSRDSMIAELEKLGKQYKWYKYDDRQLYSMLQRELSKKPKHVSTIPSVDPQFCPECGRQLTDNGMCPNCDGDSFPLDEANDDFDARFDAEFGKYDGVPMSVETCLDLLRKMREFE